MASNVPSATDPGLAGWLSEQTEGESGEGMADEAKGAFDQASDKAREAFDQN
jgi:hypothetical protein